MSTVAPALVRTLADDWEHKCGYSSAKFSGIVGDKAHEIRGGYHIGRAFQSTSNYSVVRPDDKAGNGPDDAAAAIDMTMSPADMRLCTARLVAAYANPNDPRRKYLNAFNGTLNNKTARRWDVYARRTSPASAGHLEHVHLEIRRKYVGSATAMTAVLSLLKGESVADFLKSVGVSMSAVSVSVTVPPFPGILRRDDRQKTPNAGVRQFQAQMLKRGWVSVGIADGFFGPKLESVVKRWQAVAGLTVDGEIGPKTWPTPWTRPLGK